MVKSNGDDDDDDVAIVDEVVYIMFHWCCAEAEFETFVFYLVAGDNELVTNTIW